MDKAVTFDLKGNAASFNRAVSGALGSVRRMTRGFLRFQKSILRLSGSILRLQTNMLGIQGIMKGFQGVKTAITSFASFEEGILKIAAVSGMSKNELKTLRSQVEDLTIKTKYSATEILDAAFALSSLGLNAKEIAKVLPEVIKTSIAVSAAPAEVAETHIATMKQFKVEMKDAGKVSDLIANAYSKSALNLERFTTAMQYGGPAGAAFSQNMTDVVAVLAAIKDRGLDASIAGTQFRSALANLSRPTKRIIAALEEYDLKFEDVNSTTHSFIDILGTLQNAGMETEDILAIFGKRAFALVKMLLELGTETESTTEILKRLSKEMGEVGAATKISNKMQQGLGFAFKQVSASASLFSVALGEAISNGIDLDGIAQKIIIAFGDLTEIIKGIDFRVLKQAGIKIFDPSQISQNLQFAFAKVLPAVIDMFGSVFIYGAQLFTSYLSESMPSLWEMIGSILAKTLGGMIALLMKAIQHLGAALLKFLDKFWLVPGGEEAIDKSFNEMQADIDKIYNSITGKTFDESDKGSVVKQKFEVVRQALLDSITQQQKDAAKYFYEDTKGNIEGQRRQKMPKFAEKTKLQKRTSDIEYWALSRTIGKMKATGKLREGGAITGGRENAWSWEMEGIYDFARKAAQEAVFGARERARQKKDANINIDNSGQIVHNYREQNRKQQVTGKAINRNPRGDQS